MDTPTVTPEFDKGSFQSIWLTCHFRECSDFRDKTRQHCVCYRIHISLCLVNYTLRGTVRTRSKYTETKEGWLENCNANTQKWCWDDFFEEWGQQCSCAAQKQYPNVIVCESRRLLAKDKISKYSLTFLPHPLIGYPLWIRNDWTTALRRPIIASGRSKVARTLVSF